MLLVATSALLYGSVGVLPREAHVPSRQAPDFVPDREAAPPATRINRLRCLASRVSALLADDGTSARFAAERQRDDDLVRRVERRRR